MTTDPLAYVSASRLKSFLTCRLKFYYERVLGLKSPASANLHLGKAVHSGLEAYHNARWRNEETSTEEIIGEYANAFHALEETDPVEYKSKSREDLLDTGERVLRIYLESEQARDDRNILGVEVYLRSEDTGLPLPLVGVLDLVREGPVPIDFKTIAQTPNLEEEAWQNQLQLTIYNLLLRDATGEDPESGELVYLVKTKNAKVVHQQLEPVTELHLERLKSLTEAYVDGVTREDYFPSPGMHCRWCAFRNECSAWPSEIPVKEAA